MTKILASVNSLEEVKLILSTAVDIIDLKQPEQGALGALEIQTIKEIVALVNQERLLSATIGDLPMEPELVYNATLSVAKTGVDYIKIGFFPGGDWLDCLTKLTDLVQQGYKLIAVLFADAQPDFKIINVFKAAGFSGVMLDTMNKSKGSLTQVMSMSNITDFVTKTNKSQLLCGLAGSLNKEETRVLIKLGVDYLGYRGALCERHNRNNKLNEKAIHSIIDCFG